MLPLPLSYHPRSNCVDDLHGRVTAGKRHSAHQSQRLAPRGTEIELSHADISFLNSVAGVYRDAEPLNWQQALSLSERRVIQAQFTSGLFTPA